MRVLVTGGSSLLGLYLHRFQPAGVDVHYTWWSTWQPWCLHQMDVCDPSMVGHVLAKVRPGAIVHMAAEGNVDRCEQEYTVAEATNVHGTRNVLLAAREVGARVLLTSTNAVYDGEHPPYGPDAERHPVNVYGRLRVRAEDLAMKEEGWQIIRLFLLYGWEPPGARGNWGSKAVRALEKGERLKVVDDVTYQPTWAADAARAVWKVLLDCPTERAYNVAGASSCTLHEFISVLSRIFKLDEFLVKRANFRDFGTLAPRPRDTSYDLANSAICGISCRGYEEGLEAMRDEHPPTGGR
jgi:dTDP-4-dehydrorhamnose reductase